MRALEAALELFGRVGRCFVATADARGCPHLATASRLERVSTEGTRLRIRYWFCPRTVDNVEDNPRVSVTVWDPATDEGYQMLGRVEQVVDGAYLDGVDPRPDEEVRYPSVERVLVVVLEQILDFRHAPHPDQVLEDRWNARFLTPATRVFILDT